MSRRRLYIHVIPRLHYPTHVQNSKQMDHGRGHHPKKELQINLSRLHFNSVEENGCFGESANRALSAGWRMTFFRYRIWVFKASFVRRAGSWLRPSSTSCRVVHRPSGRVEIFLLFVEMGWLWPWACSRTAGLSARRRVTNNYI